MAWFKWHGTELYLNLHVQPGASKDEFAGPHGVDRMKLRVSAPPVDGAANQRVIAFLAKSFGVSKSQVELIAGQASREKKVRISQPRVIPDTLPELRN